MKKFLVVVALVLGTCFSLSAQKAQEQMIEYNKNNVQGYSVSISDIPSAEVIEAFETKMEKIIGKKSSKSNGFSVYLNQKFSPFGAENYDIYYKIAEVGKKDLKSTQILIFVCKGNLNAITSSSDSEVAGKILSFMNDFPKYAQDFYTNKQIIKLDNQLLKMREERNGFLEKIEKMKKEINELDLKLKEKNSDIEKVEKQLLEQKEKLN